MESTAHAWHYHQNAEHSTVCCRDSIFFNFGNTTKLLSSYNLSEYLAGFATLQVLSGYFGLTHWRQSYTY